MTRPHLELHRHIFKPLEAAVADFAPASQHGLLAMYTSLLRHWTAVLQSNDDIPAHASDTTASLVRHVNLLALTLLQTSPTAGAELGILDFYDQAVRLISDAPLKRHVRIELPSPPLIYTLLFSGSLATVSRLCHILACYKRGFETAMATRARPSLDTEGAKAARVDSHTYDRPYVNRYNGYLMDMVNCFWRSRAFNDSDPNAKACTLSRATVASLASYATSVDRSRPLNTLFSLSHAPVLCLQSIERVRELEDDVLKHGDPVGGTTIRVRHGGPVTQASLTRLANAGGMRISWQDYRIEVLRSMADKGFPGVAELLKNTMTVLKKSMDGRLSIDGTPLQL